MCKGQKGEGGVRVACLPGNKVSAQLDPTLYPPGLSFGSGGAASPMQVIPMLGPASSTRGFCWKYMGGEMAPQPWSCTVPSASAAGEPRRELLEQRASGHSPDPQGNAVAWAYNYTVQSVCGAALLP